MTRDEQGRLHMSFSCSEEETSARALARKQRLKQMEIDILFNIIKDNFLKWWD